MGITAPIDPEATYKCSCIAMESFRLISLLAFLLGAQGCRVDVSVTESRGVFTPTCSLDCSVVVDGYGEGAVAPGFMAYYHEDSLDEKSFRVCMRVAEDNAIDQCVIEDQDASDEGGEECYEVTQTAVPEIFQQVGDKWMAASDTTMDQAGATQFCADNGAVLARPESMEETLAVAEFMGEDHAYIGVNDIDGEDDFYFNDASVNSAVPVSWTNWNTGEPNNNNDEDCVVLRANKEFKWNDVGCWKEFKALCQYVEV